MLGAPGTALLMPELPEVETTRRGIAPAVEGRRIDTVIVRNAALRWPVPSRDAASAARPFSGRIAQNATSACAFPPSPPIAASTPDQGGGRWYGSPLHSWCEDARGWVSRLAKPRGRTERFREPVDLSSS